jgi:hypothetical protein
MGGIHLFRKLNSFSFKSEIFLNAELGIKERRRVG